MKKVWYRHAKELGGKKKAQREVQKAVYTPKAQRTVFKVTVKDYFLKTTKVFRGQNPFDL